MFEKPGLMLRISLQRFGENNTGTNRNLLSRIVTLNEKSAQNF
jgi:hypothetical protein